MDALHAISIRCVIQTSLHVLALECGILLQHVLDRIPAARNSSTVCTAMRVPRMTGLPLQISVLTVMRSDMQFTLPENLLESMSECCLKTRMRDVQGHSP